MDPEQPGNTDQENQVEKPNEIDPSEAANEPQKPHKSRLKKILVIIGLFILGLITLVILALLIETHLRKQDINQQSKSAPQKILSSRSEAERTADKKLGQIENLITRTGITDKQIASSKIDACYVAHADQGWFAYTYYQDCYLRYVQGYTTKLSKSELKQKLLAQPDAVILFGKENGTPTIYDNCKLYQKASTAVANKVELIYRPANVTSDEYTCRVPDPLKGLFSASASVLDEELATKIYRDYDATKIDNSLNQFWFYFDEHHYHEDLGCGTNLLICDNPRPKPIQAP
jgi:hypothetical protein